MKVQPMLLIAMLLQVACNRDIQSPAELLAQAANIDKQSIISFNSGEKGDLEGYLSHFWNSPELVIVDVGKLILGFEAWKSEIISQLNQRGASRFSYTQSENIVQGNFVIGHGRYKYVLEKLGAPPKTYEGIYTDVKAMRNGKMVIVTAHYSRVNEPK